MSSFRRMRRWTQFSLRALLLLMLLVGTFFAGRHSRDRELNKVRAEAEQARKEAAQALQRAETKTPQVIWATGTINQPSAAVYQSLLQPISVELPQTGVNSGINEGMKASELEHWERFRGSLPK